MTDMKTGSVRRRTRAIQVGGVGIGGENPVKTGNPSGPGRGNNPPKK